VQSSERTTSSFDYATSVAPPSTAALESHRALASNCTLTQGKHLTEQAGTVKSELFLYQPAILDYLFQENLQPGS
jgi:hypothetical protein